MPLYDRKCSGCGAEQYNLWERCHDNAPKVCAVCGGATRREFLSPNVHGVVDDSIPGGILIEHGICWPDGTPRRYYHRSDIYRELEKARLRVNDDHVTEPGTDKAKFTTRWSVADTTNYDDPEVRRKRRADTAAWLGVSMEEYDRITNVGGVEHGVTLKDDPITRAIYGAIREHPQRY